MENAKQKSFLPALVVGLKLLLICAVVAGVVSLVYTVTLDQYEKNLQETKDRAIGEIFGKDGLSCTAVNDDGTVYSVRDGDTEIGYCVEVKSAGFGGDIELMVGYNPDHSVKAVSVVSNSETPGVGSKVMASDYLSAYSGKSGTLTLGEDVDARGGATVSSKAVLAGVNAATELLEQTLKGGAAQ